MNEVPFFANTADDTHCVQAGFRIMLKYFLPERDFSYEQLDVMSQKQAGKGTWWPPILLELQKLGLAVKCIEGFDYAAFYKEGESYVKRHYKAETADYYLEHSNLLKTKALVPEFLNKIDFEARPANFDDINNLLNNGWLVGIDLNASALNDRPGAKFISHMVVIFSRQNDVYCLHDPGLPPRPARKVSLQKLAEAWYWSGPETAALVAVKLNEDS